MKTLVDYGNLSKGNNHVHFPVPVGNAILSCSYSHSGYVIMPSVSSMGHLLRVQSPGRKSFLKKIESQHSFFDDPPKRVKPSWRSKCRFIIKKN